MRKSVALTHSKRIIFFITISLLKLLLKNCFQETFIIQFTFQTIKNKLLFKTLLYMFHKLFKRKKNNCSENLWMGIWDQSLLQSLYFAIFKVFKRFFRIDKFFLINTVKCRTMSHPICPPMSADIAGHPVTSRDKSYLRGVLGRL